MITGLALQVSALDGVREFYQDVLGMPYLRSDDDHLCCAYSESSCQVTFHKNSVTAFVDRPHNFYWKIGITVRDLDIAVHFLNEQGVDASAPRQFRDIGYMSHIKDPNGFIIELLQQGFNGNEHSVPKGHPIGAQATLAHITLRVTDIDAAKRFLENELGMRLMSVQPVTDYCFCLYFYAWSDESLPDPDLESVENREWLWARPYTLIELQHLQSADTKIHRPDKTEAGFEQISFRCINCAERTMTSDRILAL